MSDLPQSAASGARKESAPVAWFRGLWRGFAAESPHEFLVLCVVTGFLLLYGLVPIFGGDQLGLVGAGGIGVALQNSMDFFQWDRVALILLMVLAVVVVAELAVNVIRSRLI